MAVQHNIEPDADCAIVFISDNPERYARYFGSMHIPYCRFEFSQNFERLPYAETSPSAGVVFIIDCASIGKARSKELIDGIVAKFERSAFKIMVISRNICEAGRADVLKIDALLHDPPDPKELYFKLNRLAGDLLLASAAAVGASSPNDCLLIVKKDGEIISSSSCAEHAFLGISTLLPGINVLDVLKKTLSASLFEKVAEFFKNCDSSPLHISIKLNNDYFPIVFSRENQSNGHITVVLSSENYRDIAFLSSENREGLYRTFIDATDDLVFLKDSGFRYLLSNKANCIFFGRLETEVIGRDDFSLMDFSAAQKCRKSDEEALKAQRPVISEEVVGQNVFQTVKFPVVLPGGEMGIGGIIRDITKHRYDEDRIDELHSKVEEEREKCALLVNNMADEVWFADLNGKFTLANPAACRNFNIADASDLNVKDFAETLDVFRPDGSVRPAEESPPLRALSGKRTINQEEIVRLPFNGELRYRQVSSAPVRSADGSVVGCVSVVRDITEAHKVEEEKRKNDERLKRIVAILEHKSGNVQEFLDFALDQAIQLTSSKIGYIYFYDEVKKLLTLNTWSKGVMSECAVAEKMQTYELSKTGYWGEVVRQRRPMINNDFTKPDSAKKGVPEGHLALSRFMSIPVFSEDRIVAVVGLGNKTSDYTDDDVLQSALLIEAVWSVVERYKVEQQLLQLNASLDELVKKRTDELRLLNEELASFNYSVSHDLQAPLRRITGFSDLIDEEFGVGLPPALRLYIDKITTNSNLMKQIVNALLDLSRVSQKQLACDQVDLSALANSVLGDLKPDYEGRAISFEIDPDMHAFCDQQLAKILLNNVLGNAIKYTEHAADSKIEIGRCAHEDGYDAFFVSDNGIGFDNVYKNEIFKPFKRLHTEREYPGTGVGLATAERIMLRHRGKIWAEGIEGKGATFYFCFPNLSAC